MAKTVDRATLEKIREQKRKADEAYRLATRLHGSTAADRHRESDRLSKYLKRAAENDVYPLPPCGDKELRERLKFDLAAALKDLWPEAFPLEFSTDHHLFIRSMQRVLIDGGQMAVAMPRGYGKTSIAVRSAIWALLYGHRRFAVIVAAADPLATKILRSVRDELRFNDRLLSLFPEACYPIRCLEGKSIKSIAQTYDGTPTSIVWKSDELQLPQIEGSASSGARVQVAGILGGKIRGASFTTRSGQVIRPDIAIVDDPQDRESAKSPTQTADRLAVINGDIVGMAGPTRKIACIVPCTVIQQDDLADQLLNRSKNPQWNGIRTKALNAWPVNLNKWDEYRERRARGMREGMAPDYWNSFLRENWDELHAGAEPAWSERYKREDELSAVQSCMNWHFDNAEAFAAEGQNEPIKTASDDIEELTATDIGDKTNSLSRRVVPLGAQRITAFIDVQGKMLFWLVVAWTDDFGGHVLDYGSFPDQKRSVFTLADAKRTLGHVFPGSSEESRIYEGLTSLANDILGTTYHRPDGVQMAVDRCFVDSGWQTETVYKWCRESNWRDVVTPSKGRAVKASNAPMSEFKAREGERIGHYWMQTTIGRGRAPARLVQLDTNYWKTQAYRKLKLGRADKGTLTVFGEPHQHPTLFAQWLSEKPHPVRSETNGRVVWEWRAMPGRDNHWWDCIVGAMAAASFAGVVVSQAQPSPVKKKRRSLAEMAAAAGRR